LRLVKIKISTDFLQTLEVAKLLPVIEYAEIVKIYQYDFHSFFSMQRIVFKPGAFNDLEQMIYDIFKPIVFQLLEKKGNEILCIMKQRADEGFWPALVRDYLWAIVPPIQMDREFIKTSLIIKENMAENFEEIANTIKTFEILAINDIDNAPEMIGPPMPQFTERQRQIATYAVRQGFYETPKKVTAEEVAKHFEISVSAMNEHLRKTEKIAMRYFFA
jgi:hypothetical protein